MKMETKDVKSASVSVGVAEYEVFDSCQESINQLGEATVLDLINSQHRTNKLNAIRANATGTPSKKALMSMAFAEITAEEFGLVQGDSTKLANLLASKTQEIEARLKAKDPTAVVVDEDEDEDED